MATCTERPRQTSVGHYLRPGGTREYLIRGTTSKLTAQLALINTAPTTDAGLDSDGNAITIYLNHYSVREIGGGVWEAIVRYETSADTTELVITFGNATGKIFQGLEHIITYSLEDGSTDDDPNLYTGPYFDGAIGVNGDEVEGVDIEVGQVEFSIVKKYSIATFATISENYIQDLFLMLGERTPVNDAEWGFVWKGLTFVFPAGSLRLRSVPLKWNSNNEAELSYHFAYSRPILLSDEFSIANSVYIERDGWDYGWIRYRLDTANNRTVRTPEAYSVDRVYPRENFNQLEI